MLAGEQAALAQVPAVRQPLVRIEAALVLQELGELRIAGFQLLARRFQRGRDVEAAAALDRRIDDLATQLREAHARAQLLARREVQLHLREVSRRPAQEAVLLGRGLAHFHRAQRDAPVEAAGVGAGDEFFDALRGKQQLERLRAVPRGKEPHAAGRRRLLDRARERLDAQRHAVERAEKAEAADDQREELGIALPAQAAQLAVRRDEGEGMDVPHGRLAVGSGGVAVEAFRDVRQRRTSGFRRAAIAGTQRFGDARPRRGGLHLQLAPLGVETEDAVQPRRIVGAAMAQRLAELDGGKRQRVHRFSSRCGKELRRASAARATATSEGAPSDTPGRGG
jgi:hypothetical protein